MKTNKMDSSQEAVLIVNTKSRRGQDLFATAKATLEADGLNLVHAWALNEPEQVIVKAREATSRQIPLVIIGGGDGTLNCITRYFVGSQSTLGVLPLGTGNEFARDLGIRPDVKSACHVLTTGCVLEVDVGTFNDEYFLNVATTGLTTLIAQGLKYEEKRRFGRLAYAGALARALSTVRPFRATLTMPEGTYTFETVQVVVGNGHYHAGPFPISPEASLTEGKLSAYVVATTSRLGLLRFAMNLPGGHHVELDEVPTFTTTKIHLDTIPPQRVTVDGEIKCWTPVSFGIVPKALRVMVPRESPVVTNTSVGSAS